MHGILTRETFLNGITVAMAMGCSTDAVIHVLAQAQRAGCRIGLDYFDAASRLVPVIANVRPRGTTYLMQDFYDAGGLPALMSRLTQFLHLISPPNTASDWRNTTHAGGRAFRELIPRDPMTRVVSDLRFGRVRLLT